MSSSSKGNSFRVLMLGYQRVGKTSLLASMYRATQDELAENFRFQIKPANDLTSDFLMAAEDKLASATEFLVNDTIAPSDTWRTFQFEITSGSETILYLDFLDYRGGQLRHQRSEDMKKVREWLQSCLAIIVPIDSPTIMEGTGEWADLNSKWNDPKGIASILRAESKRQAPRLVILSPIKCEKYLQEGRGEELRRKVVDAYEDLLNYLRGDSGLNCVVVLPVQTIGGAKFSTFEKKDDGSVVERFVNPEHRYEPRDGDQLLRYIARFALARIEEQNLIRINELTEKIVEDLGWCPDQEAVKVNDRRKIDKSERLKLAAILRSGLQVFAQGCKQNETFKVIMGQRLLDSRS